MDFFLGEDDVKHFWAAAGAAGAVLLPDSEGLYPRCWRSSPSKETPMPSPSEAPPW
uniref:Uncharacterized protein n=1 Tax=Arundo donax TaxID=35708 RepID=A0A0A9DL16_ARUDO